MGNKPTHTKIAPQDWKKECPTYTKATEPLPTVAAIPVIDKLQQTTVKEAPALPTPSEPRFVLKRIALDQVTFCVSRRGDSSIKDFTGLWICVPQTDINDLLGKQQSMFANAEVNIKQREKHVTAYWSGTVPADVISNMELGMTYTINVELEAVITKRGLILECVDVKSWNSPYLASLPAPPGGCIPSAPIEEPPVYIG